MPHPESLTVTGETWTSEQCKACDALTTFLWWNLGRAELGRAEVLAGNMGKCIGNVGIQKLIETPRKIRKAMLFQESQESTSKISKSHCQHVEPAHSLQLSA